MNIFILSVPFINLNKPINLSQLLTYCYLITIINKQKNVNVGKMKRVCLTFRPNIFWELQKFFNRPDGGQKIVFLL